jgi:hypothetical protein
VGIGCKFGRSGVRAALEGTRWDMYCIGYGPVLEQHLMNCSGDWEEIGSLD